MNSYRKYRNIPSAKITKSLIAELSKSIRQTSGKSASTEGAEAFLVRTHEPEAIACAIEL
jgi:hypothetical protein